MIYPAIEICGILKRNSMPSGKREILCVISRVTEVLKLALRSDFIWHKYWAINVKRTVAFARKTSNFIGNFLKRISGGLLCFSLCSCKDFLIKGEDNWLVMHTAFSKRQNKSWKQVKMFVCFLRSLGMLSNCINTQLWARLVAIWAAGWFKKYPNLQWHECANCWLILGVELVGRVQVRWSEISAVIKANHCWVRKCNLQKIKYINNSYERGKKCPIVAYSFSPWDTAIATAAL